MAVEFFGNIWWRKDLDTYEKAVLLACADRADDDGVLWYANETIAWKTSMTTRGVQKVIDRLIAMQLMKKVHRHDRSNFYIIDWDKLPDCRPTARPKKERGPLDLIDDDEPDLFGARGERRSGRRGEPGSARGEHGSVRGEHGSPDSLSDSLRDSEEESPDDLLCKFVETSWAGLVELHPEIAGFGALDDERKRNILRRTAEWTKKKDLEGRIEDVWKVVFEVISSSKLCTGQSTPWSVTIAWLLKKANFRKVMERNYGNGRDRLGTAERGDRSAIEAGREALEIVRGHRERSSVAASAAR